jgi:hypothetical protein
MKTHFFKIRGNYVVLINKQYMIFYLLSIFIAGILICITVFYSYFYLTDLPISMVYKVDQSISAQAATAALVTSPFQYSFKVPGTLAETGDMDGSSSPYWWLNSGGLFYLQDGVGMTIQGELTKYQKWRLAYALSNPVDTDNGYHPQNILRLVTRSKWQNFTQECFYLVTKDELSASPNRNASNGLFLFNRYVNQDNLYYTGLRVDGAAVIKKKIKGIYYTMTYKPFIAGPKYDLNTNPNLIPKNVWIGLRSQIINNPDGTVSIKFWIDQGRTGNWVLAAEAIDDGKTYGKGVISIPGYAGLRTDFMDVKFDDYQMTKL